MADRPISDYQFERFLEEEKLMGARCTGCGALFVPPRAICAKCHGSEMEWVETRGEGQLVAFTCIVIGPPEMIEEGYDRNNPYCTGAVELVEGPRVVARIEGVDTLHPGTIKIGLPVKATFLHRGTDENRRIILGFTPIEED